MTSYTRALCAAAAVCVVSVGALAAVRAYRVGDSSFTVRDAPPVVTAEVMQSHIKDGKMLLNSASAAELAELPGIGEVLAARIIEYRQEHGGFSSVEELTEVYGIGQTVLNGLADYVTVEDSDENTGS
jgi:comEA protein